MEMVEATLTGKRYDDGFGQRFQTMVWRTHSTDEPKDSMPDKAAYEKAETAFMHLYEITPEDVECIPDDRFPYLRFDLARISHHR